MKQGKRGRPSRFWGTKVQNDLTICQTSTQISEKQKCESENTHERKPMTYVHDFHQEGYKHSFGNENASKRASNEQSKLVITPLPYTGLH